MRGLFDGVVIKIVIKIVEGENCRVFVYHVLVTCRLLLSFLVLGPAWALKPFNVIAWRDDVGA
ncbi:hypothetical protein BDN70DRAFT_877086 [Pholiota conissans]|uniref:Uncharacterized protein n=1 Tax=Pholiota conissans TaxID=109636 RepID=A0A9P5Z3N6_9AGAR|nr:hypothetical protein BDN70DRAFT_877086 [Pholiota conissans]